MAWEAKTARDTSPEKVSRDAKYDGWDEDRKRVRMRADRSRTGRAAAAESNVFHESLTKRLTSMRRRVMIGTNRPGTATTCGGRSLKG